jgi:hypothetical protein
VRGSGVVVLLEGVLAILYAIALVIAGIRGADAKVAYGTAGLLLLVGAVVSAAGRALWQGRHWGRGVAVFTQLLLLPIAYYMFSGSHRPELGVPLGAVAVLTLALLFSPQALRWASGQPDSAQPDSAKSDSADPDIR